SNERETAALFSEDGGVKTSDEKKEPGTASISFTDLLQSPSATNDEGITKMVAEVGRWWFSSCYETVAPLPPPSSSADRNAPRRSLWADEALLHECEKRQTSFRMLIAYAQKPMVAARRTVSL
ncbi:hypothetical protein LTS18_006550, partial [Coniosporium uncinatum]